MIQQNVIKKSKCHEAGVVLRTRRVNKHICIRSSQRSGASNSPLSSGRAAICTPGTLPIATGTSEVGKPQTRTATQCRPCHHRHRTMGCLVLRCQSLQIVNCLDNELIWKSATTQQFNCICCLAQSGFQAIVEKDVTALIML